ncbi:uncharacterized protein PV09_09129 [Verruconis gallopava]|uniref:WW domain-containing protein n=1 Tax=Verruconis gallopava TaxID=253628 RepID=A0A0D1XAF4_9PEZI|nr:uncharacterized protein PV09_09129 [Verruconis gallopava]KIV99175.1 hypothetical protein PV09_09129 [Verruconis gallopava]
MPQSSVTPNTPIQAVPRKAVARKAIGGVGSAPASETNIVKSPDAEASSIPTNDGLANRIIPITASSPALTLIPAHTQTAQHSELGANGFSSTSSPQLSQQQEVASRPDLQRRASSMSYFSNPHMASTVQPVGYAGQAVHENSSMSAVHPQQTGVASQAEGQAQSPNLWRMNSLQSVGSVFSSSHASGWPASPSSMISDQTGCTSPLSRFSTASDTISPGGGASILTGSMSQSPPATKVTSLPTCAQCRAVIQANVSKFECLICWTGAVITTFCVYCFTSGSAATGHAEHDKSFFVNESDPEVQPGKRAEDSISQSLPHLSPVWIIRKNYAGRIWYQHRATGFRTHIRPMTAVVPPPSLLAGWEAHASPDGKQYYYNKTTGVSTWNAPVASPLPYGWKEVRTPDGVPFYVHEVLQLACWERPGQAPKARSGTPSSSEITVESSAPVKTTKSGSKSTVAHGVAAAGAAASLANDISQLSNGASLTPQGIMSATIAAARLTTHGAKFAGKTMGRLAKSQKIRRASRIFTQASHLATLAEGGSFEGGGYGDNGSDDVDAGFTDSFAECEDDSTAVDDGYQQPQDVGFESQYVPSVTMQPVQETYQPPFAPYVQDQVVQQQVAFVQDDSLYAPSEPPPAVVNDVYVTEDVSCSGATVEETNVEVSVNVQSTVDSSYINVNEVQQLVTIQEQQISTQPQPSSPAAAAPLDTYPPTAANANLGASPASGLGSVVAPPATVEIDTLDVVSLDALSPPPAYGLPPDVIPQSPSCATPPLPAELSAVPPAAGVTPPDFDPVLDGSVAVSPSA